ncbi:GTPase-activating protein [Saccharomycopsis crataegensis]|uniref:GTPase-activating protein GYP7 n=1 Tax=Saccharomycopsis crataegensis TaxID=43959 RepID=A0AAV5QIU0_9ASCO|nr:GTPase-activating protein [Saccharomycopsis crataegensis]
MSDQTEGTSSPPTVTSRVTSREAHPEEIYPPGSVKLLWAKGKVYVHPSKNKKDNVAGFLTLSKEHNTTNKDILVSFTPEYSLSATEVEVFNECDLKTNVEDAEVANLSKDHLLMYQRKNGTGKQFFVKKSIISGIGSYAFSLPISNIYSIQSRTPNLGWWWGSIIINSRSNFEKLPVLFFHDDESQSTLKHQSMKNKDFNPFSSNNPADLFYGGDQFFDCLKKYCVVEKSSLEQAVYLINPTSDDLRAFAPLNVVEQDTTPIGLLGDASKESINKFLTGAKWTILESLARVSQLAKKNVSTVINDSPEPVKKLLQRPEIKRLNDDFDSANIYLAKWALSIQEEAERNKKKYVLDDSYRNLLNSELGITSIDSLSAVELEKAQRTKEVSKIEWDSFFDNAGRLSITVGEVKERIFHGGVSSTVRSEAWLFLLGVYPWDSSSFERKQILRSLNDDYNSYLSKWQDNLEELQNDAYWKDQRFRIEKDVNRNDRNISLYKENGKESEDDVADNIKLNNPHLRNLKEILLTYNQYNKNLGYVQGMCDLLSVIYYVYQDNNISFWCFVKFMERMERNFLRDQSGMKTQMETLNQLVSLMLPNLFLHLEKCDSINLFFFFRMLLVWFKREFMFEDIIPLWENFFTDYYSSQFHLFFCLAILSKHERIIIEHLSRFDEVLKYMNDLSLTMDMKDLLVRAELLFLRFRKMVDIIDHGVLNDKLNTLRAEILKNNKGKRNQPLESSLPHAYEVTDDLRSLLSKDIIIQQEKERIEGEPSD